MALDSGYFEVSKSFVSNGDRIRAMTDEELAKETVVWATAIAALANPHATIDGNYESEMREWLKQPAEVKK